MPGRRAAFGRPAAGVLPPLLQRGAQRGGGYTPRSGALAGGRRPLENSPPSPSAFCAHTPTRACGGVGPLLQQGRRRGGGYTPRSAGRRPLENSPPSPSAFCAPNPHAPCGWAHCYSKVKRGGVTRAAALWPAAGGPLKTHHHRQARFRAHTPTRACGGVGPLLQQGRRRGGGYTPRSGALAGGRRPLENSPPSPSAFCAPHPHTRACGGVAHTLSAPQNVPPPHRTNRSANDNARN